METLTYFGAKNRKYLDFLIQILPEEKPKHIIETCMGSGSFTQHISSGIKDVKKTAIELDKGMFALHSQIKQDADILIKNIKNLANKEEVYYEKKQMIADYLEGKTEYSNLDIAVAELYTLVFSFNFMRGSWRSNTNYLKYEDPMRRMKAKRSMEAFESILHFHMPLVLCELYEKWQNVNLIHGSFMDYKHMWKDEKALIFLDLPYQYSKRGVKDSRKTAGYMVEMTDEQHNEFISEVIRFKEEGTLKAKMMICTNYTLNENGEIIISKDDLYCQLLKHGFRLVQVQEKSSSEIIRKTSLDGKKMRQKKMEVVLVNYLDIVGNWNSLKYLDACDVYGR